MITLDKLDLTEQDLKDIGFKRHDGRAETLETILNNVNKGKVKNNKVDILKWICLRLHKSLRMALGR